MEIARAIRESDLLEYTKHGCLDSLELWSEERAVPKIAGQNSTIALLFLGDSYLTYNFAFAGMEDGNPILLRQVSEVVEQFRLTNDELVQLTTFVGGSPNDPAPSNPDRALHQTCVVFFTQRLGYFLVQLDESFNSRRNADLAVKLMAEVSQGAP
ncbi:hypothetical protein [Cognatiluteimonas weifangensis]|uniref:hypothetical protein n=1 Tax=Cognatiluteimonas weifangensis TaxID=2303539 RepID=UPI0011C13F38|nr:hypothetical protein [Luteimonas weifangensis]